MSFLRSVIPAKAGIHFCCQNKLLDMSLATGTRARANARRHSREGGNPFIKLEQALIWVPACAGTTLRTGFQPAGEFFHTLLRVNGAAVSLLRAFPLQAAAGVAAFALAALAAMLLLTAGAEARHHRYRHREVYSAPASAMAIDLYTGHILYAKNANVPRYPASVTKVMTLYLLFDAMRDGKISMNTRIRVSAHAAAQSPTKLGLSEGDTITVADAIGAIVTKSANDMAVAVGEALAGSEEEFARRMTQKARTIGMLHTTFRNASGLPNDEQKTTAQDLIVLGINILADHPERCKVFSTKYFQYDGEVFRNHNTLLFTYPGMEGMKTGFTSAAGFNLLATARRGDKRLLAVVLGGSSSSARNASMRTILDNSWSKAMTLAAARKSGMLARGAKPAAQPAQRHAEAPPPAPKPEPVRQTSAKPAGGAVAAKQEPGAVRTVAVSTDYLKLKRRPDRASMSMLLVSIEAGLVKRKPAAAEPEPVASNSTDEPEEAASRSTAHAAPPPQEIARNETITALSAPKTQNVSVHYKTVRLAEVAPLAAASLDGVPPPPAPVAAVPPAQSAPAPKPAAAREEVTLTLAAATAAESRSMDRQPGPFHIQTGAFSSREEALARLESVRQALGAATMKAHPEFIMPVSLTSGQTMFRARLGRFASADDAKAICRRLKHSGIECWDIHAD